MEWGSGTIPFLLTTGSNPQLELPARAGLWHAGMLRHGSFFHTPSHKMGFSAPEWKTKRFTICSQFIFVREQLISFFKQPKIIDLGFPDNISILKLRL